MSLPHIILTVLSTHESTGYDITKQFSSSLGYCWKASHQQVYRELNKMANNDLVTCRHEPQEGKPDRKVYSMTDLGRESLIDWLEKPASNPIIRDELSAKLLACSIHNSEAVQRHIEVMIEERQCQLDHYRTIEHLQLANHKELGRSERLQRLTLLRNIHNSQAWIYWAEEVLSELKDIDRNEMLIS